MENCPAGKFPSFVATLFVATKVSCRRTSHPLAATDGVSFKVSRPHHSFEGIAIVAT